MEPTPPGGIEKLEQAIGYTFLTRGLLDQAFIHPSARHELNLTADNQRMEYLGDAVLGLVAAEYGYHHHAGHDEGRLTMLRSALASTSSLAETARALGLGALLVLGRGEESSGGREKESNLADALEAVIGACYLDGGLGAARRVFEALFQPAIERIDQLIPEDNPKGRLQEWAQQRGLSCPVYTVLEEEGPSHQRRYTVEVRVGTFPAALGNGSAKRIAEAAAARTLMEHLARMIQERHDVPE